MIQRLLERTGYVLVRRTTYRRLERLEGSAHYVLHRYLDDHGDFDYESYRRIQNAGNRQKIGNVFVREENIAFLAEYVKHHLGRVDFGICHGTRRGAEQAWFRRYLDDGAEVIGTEIADSAAEFAHTVQWDFHQVKEEWVGAADFIYSNSLDHSYDPEKAVNAWMRCLKPDGMCLLEHTKAHRPEKSNGLDPFGARLETMPFLIATWGRGAYAVGEILEAPQRYSRGTATAVLVVEPRRRAVSVDGPVEGTP
jgi:SAM-dependent methyltransferase